MRAAPPVEVVAGSSRVWTVAVGVVVVAALGALVAWLGSLEDDRLPWAGSAIAGLAVTATLCIGLAATITRVPPRRLAWDGQCWCLHEDATADADSGQSGDVHVVIDAGGWMLLHFRPAVPMSWRSTAWLPIGKGADAARWHAFRCAVYSPRSAAAHPGRDPADPSSSNAPRPHE